MNAIILAGGKSSRFGRNKALIRFVNKTLLEMIVDKLNQVFENVYIITNQKPQYRFVQEVEIYQDIIPNMGPLGGLYTGLKHSNTEYNFLTACDMPNLNLQFLHFLRSYEQDYDVLVPEFNGYVEPLAGIYSKENLNNIEKCLISRELKLKSFFEQVKVKIIPEKDIRKIGKPEQLFFNINYQEDLFNQYIQL